MDKPILKIALTLCLISIGFKPFAQLNIDSCHQKAKLNFPLIKQYDLIEKSKAYNIANANKAYLPQLDATIIGGILEGLPSMSLPGTTKEETTVDLKMIAMVQANQVIWDGGITKAKKKNIEASTEIAKANIEVSLYALEERVNNLFFGILLIDEQEKQINILYSTLERRYKRVEVAVENGTAFQSDLDEIMVELIKIKQQKESLKFNRIAYIDVLGAMIGEGLENDIELLLPHNVPQLSESINRPELNLYKNQLLLSQAQLDMQNAMLYPKLGLMGFGTFIQPGTDFGTSSLDNIMVAGLSLKWNLGSLYSHSNNKKLVEIERQKVALQKEAFLYTTNLELKQTNAELQRYQKLIEKDQDILDLRKRIKTAYDIKYDNGTCTMADLLDKVNEESAAQQQLNTRKMQYLLKRYLHQTITGNRTL